MYDFDIYEELSSTVAILVKSDDGILLILDPKKARLLWKAPGGGVKEGETQEQAAVRELKEETGVRISEDELVLLHDEFRRTPSPHSYYFFGADIGEDTFEERGLVPEGETGEQTKIIHPDSPPSAIELGPQLRIVLNLDR